jgi:transposase InsO family protein
VQLLDAEVLPTFEAHGASIDAILSDHGREFCGRPDRHPYELFLQLEGIAHRTTKVRRPQSNGIVERLHRTLLDEHFRVEGRRTWFETLDEMQTVLDSYLDGYNQRRPHQGRCMHGRTPCQAFTDGLLNTPAKEDTTKTPTPKNAA